jgi:hypothetical protein
MTAGISSCRRRGERHDLQDHSIWDSIKSIFK